MGVLSKITCAFNKIGVLAYRDFYFYCDFYCDYCDYCDFDFDGYYPENAQFTFTRPGQSQPHKTDANPLVCRCIILPHLLGGRECKERMGHPSFLMAVGPPFSQSPAQPPWTSPRTSQRARMRISSRPRASRNDLPTPKMKTSDRWST